jgi:DNA (cytosine-5)-methyltransferase 1
MNYLSVCSGIEAATVAWHPLGWQPTAFSEIEKFPSAVLAHHYPTVPNLGDMTRFQEWDLACDCDLRREQSRATAIWRRMEGRRDDVHAQHAGSTHDRSASDYGARCERCGRAAFDLLVGGTPCQSFSVAGLRKGLADPRGSLLLVYLAIADRYRPRWLVWENVPGVLSADGGRAFGSLLGGLAELGYGFAYRILDAQYFGLAQRRQRVFVVGHLGDWRRAAAVLFERESLQGHPAPRREAGQEPAPCLGAGPVSGGRTYGTDADSVRSLVPTPPVSLCLNAGGMGRIDAESETLIPTGGFFDVAHSLRADGFDASEDGTGRGTPLVCFDERQITSKDNRSQCGGDVAATLRAGGHHKSHANAGVMPAVAFQPGNLRRGAGAGPSSESFPTLNARGSAGISDQQPHVSVGMQVRRLTPRECERLQGFPDDYTLIPYRGKFAADGPRYKALGNSMAVPCMYWIGRRIQMVDAIEREAVA